MHTCLPQNCIFRNKNHQNLEHSITFRNASVNISLHLCNKSGYLILRENHRAIYFGQIPRSWEHCLLIRLVKKHQCHCPAMWCHFVNGPSHMVASSLHNVTLVGWHFYFLSFFCWLLFCWGWQLRGWVFWLWQTASIYSVPAGSIYCIYNLCFVQLLLFKNRACCENSEMTVRLSAAQSVPLLTAGVTVVSDSPFHFVPFSSTFNFSDSVICFLLHCNLGCLLSFLDCHFYWDRNSLPGSGWAAVNCGAVSTSGQALQLRISSKMFFCPVTY